MKRSTRPWVLIAGVAFVAGVATGATWLAHRYVERGHIRASCGNFGTVCLNDLLGLESDSGMDAFEAVREWPPLWPFFNSAARAAKPYIRNSENSYDVWMVGFYAARGWPFCSYAPWSRLGIGETKVPPDPTLGPYPYHFGPSTLSEFELHLLLIDEFGGDPFRPWALAANWTCYALAAGLLWWLAAWVIRRIRARRMQRRRGFPVLVGEDI